MRRWLTMTLLVCALWGSATACTAAQNEELIEHIGHEVQTHRVVRADFTQTKHMAALKRPLVTNGQLVFAQRQGVLWQIEAPYRMAYVLGIDQVVEISTDGARRSRQFGEVAGLAQVGRIFRALFGADMSVLREIFDIAATGSADKWDMVLRPRQAEVSQFVRSVSLSGGRFIESIRVDETNGDATRIRLRNTAAADQLAPGELALFGAGR